MLDLTLSLLLLLKQNVGYKTGYWVVGLGDGAG